MQEQYPYQEEYIPVPQQQTVPYPSPQMFGGTPQDRADLLDKIQPDSIVEVLKHRLMGQKIVNGEWVKDELLESVSLSYSGAERIAVQMLSIAHQNTSVSSLTDDEIKHRLSRMANELVLDCIEHWEEYGIKDKSTLYYINNIVFTVGNCLYRF